MEEEDNLTEKIQPRIILLIPALNPDNKLIDLINMVHLENPQIEIIIVNDGSSSKFQTIFQKLKNLNRCTICKHTENLGKGTALKTGLKYI